MVFSKEEIREASRVLREAGMTTIANVLGYMTDDRAEAVELINGTKDSIDLVNGLLERKEPVMKKEIHTYEFIYDEKTDGFGSMRFCAETEEEAVELFQGFCKETGIDYESIEWEINQVFDEMDEDYYKDDEEYEYS